MDNYIRMGDSQTAGETDGLTIIYGWEIVRQSDRRMDGQLYTDRR